MMPKAPDERTEMNPWPEWPRVCKTDYGQQEAAAVFGHDPRVYQTTVKEFKKDKNGKVCKAVLVKLEPKKDEKTGRMMMAEVAGSEYDGGCRSGIDRSRIPGKSGLCDQSIWRRSKCNAQMLRLQPGAYKYKRVKMSSQQAICTEDSHWLYGQSVKGARLQKL